MPQFDPYPFRRNVAIDVRAVKDKIPSKHVVSVSILIVVDTIRSPIETIGIFSTFSGVVPDVVADIRMVVAKAVVEDGDDHALAPSGDSPSFSDIQVYAFFSIELCQGRPIRARVNAD